MIPFSHRNGWNRRTFRQAMPTKCGRRASSRCLNFHAYLSAFSVFKRRNKKLEIRIPLDGKTNKVRGRRLKRETERDAESTKGESTTLGNSEAIDVSSFAPRGRHVDFSGGGVYHPTMKKAFFKGGPDFDPYLPKRDFPSENV